LQVIQRFVIAMPTDKTAIRFLDHDLADTERAARELGRLNSACLSERETWRLSGATAAATQKRQIAGSAKAFCQL